jgi:hypothetical protein
VVSQSEFEEELMISLSRVPARLCLCLLVVGVGVGVAASPASAVASLPPNDDFANAADLGGGRSAAASGSNLWATAEPNEPGRPFAPALASVWYRWSAPENGVVAVRTCRSDFDTTLTVYRGSALGALGRVAANDDSCRFGSAVRFFAIAGTTYYMAVDGATESQGSVELRLRYLERPANDDFATAHDLGNGTSAKASGSNREATAEPREPLHHRRRALSSVWYRWTAPANRRVVIDTCGSSFDTVIAVYTGAGFDALRPVTSDDDSCGTRSIARFSAVAGTTYHVAVDSFARLRGSIEIGLARLKQSARRRVTASGRTAG